MLEPFDLVLRRKYIMVGLRPSFPPAPWTASRKDEQCTYEPHVEKGRKVNPPNASMAGAISHLLSLRRQVCLVYCGPSTVRRRCEQSSKLSY